MVIALEKEMSYGDEARTKYRGVTWGLGREDELWGRREKRGIGVTCGGLGRVEGNEIT